MIILDEADEPQKFPSDDSHSVRRATTPSPSLPDYEASQSQAQHREPQQQQGGWWWHRHSKARMRRAAIYGLIVYFIVTVVVGVPVIVVVSAINPHPHSLESLISFTETAPPRPPKYLFTTAGNRQYPEPDSGRE